jgi:hypothetical protein
MERVRRDVCTVAFLGIAIGGVMLAACQIAPPDDEPPGVIAAAATGCTCGSPPCACDDGQAASCPSPPGTVTLHHLLTFVPGADPLGACVAVVSPVAGCGAAVRGDVITLSGSGGTGYDTRENAILTGSSGCLRVENVAWDSAWEATGPSHAGSILNASLRFKAVGAWINQHVRQGATTPLCAEGSSGGSSLLLYQLFDNGLKAAFDHVQTVNATPFSRIDLGCGLDTPVPPHVCSNSAGQSNDGSEYGSATNAVRAWTQDPSCGTSMPSTAAFLAQSVLTSASVPVLTLSKTTLSAFRCGRSSTGLNATYGQAEYIFGASADLATTAQGKISLAKAPHYANGQSCTTPASCPVNFVCETDCTGPEGLTQADFNAAAMDMISNCVVH